MAGARVKAAQRESLIIDGTKALFELGDPDHGARRHCRLYPIDFANERRR